MVMKRASHSVYDTSYHLVWAPKYRKWVLQGEIRQRVKELFEEIGGHHGFEMKELEVAKDHVHVFLGFPPRYAIAKVVGILKAVSAREVRKEFPKVKDELSDGEFWEDGYFARTVGDEVTTEMITRYIQFHEKREKAPEHLKLI